MTTHAEQIQQIQTDLQPEFSRISAYYAAQTHLDMTGPEAMRMLHSVTASYMRAIEEGPLAVTTGDAKKAAVTTLVLNFFDTVIAPLNIPWIPGDLQQAILVPLIRKMIPAIVSGVIDSLSTVLNRTGWFDVPAGTNGATTPAPAAADLTPVGFIPY